jgi:antitoxin YefM
MTLGYVTLTELRANMAKHFDKLEQDRTELVVTRQNHEPVVIMPLAELEGLRETLHLLSTPANAERLRASIAEANAGQLVEHELIDP